MGGNTLLGNPILLIILWIHIFLITTLTINICYLISKEGKHDGKYKKSRVLELILMYAVIIIPQVSLITVLITLIINPELSNTIIVNKLLCTTPWQMTLIFLFLAPFIGAGFLQHTHKTDTGKYTYYLLYAVSLISFITACVLVVFFGYFVDPRIMIVLKTHIGLIRFFRGATRGMPSNLVYDLIKTVVYASCFDFSVFCGLYDFVMDEDSFDNFVDWIFDLDSWVWWMLHESTRDFYVQKFWKAGWGILREILPHYKEASESESTNDLVLGIAAIALIATLVGIFIYDPELLGSIFTSMWF